MKYIVDYCNFRALIIAVIAAGNLVSIRADVSIVGLLQNLTTRLEEIATAPVLQSNDSYVLEEYLNVMLIQNPEIREIARFQPDGSIVKIAASTGFSVPERNVDSEPWFTSVCQTRAPYNSLIKDKQGAPLLFRAWPILGPGPEKKILGVTCVKVDLNKFIQSVSENKNDPLEVLYNGIPVFRRNWKDIHSILEDSFIFSGAERFVVRYTDPRADLSAQKSPASEQTTASPKDIPVDRSITPAAAQTMPAEKEIQPESEPDTAASPTLAEPGLKIPEELEPETAAVAPVPDKAPGTLITAPSAQKVAESANAATLQSRLSTNSILTTGYIGSSNRRVVLFVLLFTGLGFVVVFIIATIMIRRSRRRRNLEKERKAILKPDRVPVTMAEKDTQPMDKEEGRTTAREETRLVEKIPAVRPEFSGKQLDETSCAERETKELPALREFIDDFLKKIHDVSHENNINQRNRIFEEINDDLNLWARSEIKQLSGRLGLLLQAIKECERKEGNSAELQVLRYEVMRIIKEIDDVEERLPKRNSVLIVN
jgi:hypothetical protein